MTERLQGSWKPDPLAENWAIAREIGDVELKEKQPDSYTDEDKLCSAEIKFKNGPSTVWAKATGATAEEALGRAVIEARRLGASCPPEFDRERYGWGGEEG